MVRQGHHIYCPVWNGWVMSGLARLSKARKSYSLWGLAMSGADKRGIVR